MKYNYTKQEYLEGFNKIKEMAFGGIEIATIVSDEEYIERMNKKIESLDILEELMNEDYNGEEFIEASDKILYIAFDTETNNKFFFLLMNINLLCKDLIKSYSMELITREEYDNIILLDNELDKMIFNSKDNRAFTRGKFDYIHEYITKLMDRMYKRQENRQ